MEPEINKIVDTAMKEAAERMIRKGEMTTEEIAEYLPLLSVEEIKKIEVDRQLIN